MNARTTLFFRNFDDPITVQVLRRLAQIDGKRRAERMLRLCIRIRVYGRCPYPILGRRPPYTP